MRAIFFKFLKFILLFWVCFGTASFDTDTLQHAILYKKEGHHILYPVNFVCRVNRFRVMIDFLRDGSLYEVFCKTIRFSALNGLPVLNNTKGFLLYSNRWKITVQLTTLFIPGFFLTGVVPGRRGFHLHPVTPLSFMPDDSNFVQNYFVVRSIFKGKENQDQIDNDVTMASYLLWWVSPIRNY